MPGRQTGPCAETEGFWGVARSCVETETVCGRRGNCVQSWHGVWGRVRKRVEPQLSGNCWGAALRATERPCEGRDEDPLCAERCAETRERARGTGRALRGVGRGQPCATALGAARGPARAAAHQAVSSVWGLRAKLSGLVGTLGS